MALEIENFSDLQQMIENDTLDDYIMQLLNTYENLGPLPGLLLPMLEAFLPFLPLFVFVLANSMAYGLLEGFLFSWAGAVVGAILVFTLIRRLGQTRLFQFIRRNKQVKKVMSWAGKARIWLIVFAVMFPVFAVSSHQCGGGAFQGQLSAVFSCCNIGQGSDDFHDIIRRTQHYILCNPTDENHSRRNRNSPVLDAWKIH